MSTSSVIDTLNLNADQMSVLNAMKEVAKEKYADRTIFTRGECKTIAFLAAPRLNRTLTWCPAWFIKNNAARAKNEAGEIVHGMFNLYTPFVLVEKVVKVKAAKSSKLLTEVINATEEMAKTVESEQLVNDVIAATETPIVAEVASDKKANRKNKRAAKAAAAATVETTETAPAAE